MKEILLYLFFLIPYLIKSKEKNVTEVIVGDSDMKNLNTSVLVDTYFYMGVTRQKYGPLYFFLNDTHYSLKPVQCYVSYVLPNSTNIDDSKFKPISTYKTKEGKDYKEYYYRYILGDETWGKEKALVVKYGGLNSAGSLQARSSFEDLYSLFNSKLTSLHIVLIVAGCIIFIGILATVLVCVCKKRKQSKVGLGTIDPRPLVRDTTASANLMTIN